MRTWEDDGGGGLGLEDDFGVLQQLEVEGGEPGVSVVGGRPHQGTLDVLMDVHGPCRVASPFASGSSDLSNLICRK